MRVKVSNKTKRQAMLALPVALLALAALWWSAALHLGPSLATKAIGLLILASIAVICSVYMEWMERKFPDNEKS